MTDNNEAKRPVLSLKRKPTPEASRAREKATEARTGGRKEEKNQTTILVE